MIWLTSKGKIDAENFKLEIARHWEIMDHGPIRWFLGFQIKRDWKARIISINQQAYIESMVEKFRLTGAKWVSTPMEANVQFSVQQSPSTVNQSAHMQNVPYSEAIGSVLYPGQMRHMLSGPCHSSLRTRVQLIGKPWNESSVIWEARRIYGWLLEVIMGQWSRGIVIQIGLVSNIVTQSLDFLSILAMALCRGAQRNRMLLPCRVRRPNTSHKPTRRRKPCGCEILSVECKARRKKESPCYVITKGQSC